MDKQAMTEREREDLKELVELAVQDGLDNNRPADWTTDTILTLLTQPQEQEVPVKFGPMFNIEWPEPSVWVPGKWNDFHMRALGVAAVVRSALRGDTKITVEAFAALDSLMSKAIDAGNLSEPQEKEEQIWIKPHELADLRDDANGCAIIVSRTEDDDDNEGEDSLPATLIIHEPAQKERDNE